MIGYMTGTILKSSILYPRDAIVWYRCARIISVVSTARAFSRCAAMLCNWLRSGGSSDQHTVARLVRRWMDWHDRGTTSTTRPRTITSHKTSAWEQLAWTTASTGLVDHGQHYGSAHLLRALQRPQSTRCRWVEGMRRPRPTSSLRMWSSITDPSAA